MGTRSLFYKIDCDGMNPSLWMHNSVNVLKAIEI